MVFESPSALRPLLRALTRADPLKGGALQYQPETRSGFSAMAAVVAVDVTSNAESPDSPEDNVQVETDDAHLPTVTGVHFSRPAPTPLCRQQIGVLTNSRRLDGGPGTRPTPPLQLLMRARCFKATQS